jgi:hypothetical protein
VFLCIVIGVRLGLPELRPSLRSEIRQRWLESAAGMFGGKSPGDGVDATNQRLEGFLNKGLVPMRKNESTQGAMELAVRGRE